MKELRDDTRGAVMLTGVFMAFILVGALWYVIGIGDAIIFRDRMQEATDSAVFSSAAVHAKGMNFISVCNILLLVMALFHIVAGIAQDLTILACLSVMFSIPACPKVPGAVKGFHKVSDAMKSAMTVTANASSAIALAAPLAGTARGMSIGSEYGNQGRIGKVTVLAIGPSNFPGAVAGKGILLKKAVPLGLPVSGQPFSMLCERIGRTLSGLFTKLIPLPFDGFFGDIIDGAAAGIFKYRYCNDMGSAAGTADMVNKVRGKRKEVESELRTGEKQTKARNEQQGGDNGQLGLEGIRDYDPKSPDLDSATSGGQRDSETPVNGWKKWFDPGFDRGWGDPGVLTVDDEAGNGTFAQQVWAVTIDPEYLDTNERKVSIAGSIGKNGLPVVPDSKKGSPFIGYFAQAEFYYDCGKEWDDEECNGVDGNASFGVSWRARLRYLEMPNLWNLLTRIVNGEIRDAISTVLDKAVNGNPVAKAFARSAAGAITVDIVSGWIAGKVDGWVTDPVTKDVTKFLASQGATLEGSYH